MTGARNTNDFDRVLFGVKWICRHRTSSDIIGPLILADLGTWERGAWGASGFVKPSSAASWALARWNGLQLELETVGVIFGRFFPELVLVKQESEESHEWIRINKNIALAYRPIFSVTDPNPQHADNVKRSSRQAELAADLLKSLLGLNSTSEELG